jgi:hypothetical protein
LRIDGKPKRLQEKFTNFTAVVSSFANGRFFGFGARFLVKEFLNFFVKIRLVVFLDVIDYIRNFSTADKRTLITLVISH